MVTVTVTVTVVVVVVVVVREAVMNISGCDGGV